MNTLFLKRRALRGLALLLLGGFNSATAAELQVAVASSFAPALEAVGEAYTRKTGHTLRLARASTGKLYAQIVNGAPYDLFFAADARRPMLLETAGKTLAGSGFVYATGRLVLWNRSGPQGPGAIHALREGDYRYLAIANPRHAPYGAAAQRALEALALWQAVQPRLVRGENVGQTLQFVQSGNAELGFVASAQLAALPELPGEVWTVPQELYPPLHQRVALLRDSPAAQALLAFMRSEVARELLRSYGYDLPGQ